MRRVTTGVDESGRSCIVEDTDVDGVEFVPGIGLHFICETLDMPPPARSVTSGGRLLPTRIAPGLVQWHVVTYAPSVEAEAHHTDTLDFGIVVAGRVELLLDDGGHWLEAGECVVVTGVDHGWRAGPDGCTFSVLNIGTPPAP
jgi:hypothetical protein